MREVWNLLKQRGFVSLQSPLQERRRRKQGISATPRSHRGKARSEVPSFRHCFGAVLLASSILLIQLFLRVSPMYARHVQDPPANAFGLWSYSYSHASALYLNSFAQIRGLLATEGISGELSRRVLAKGQTKRLAWRFKQGFLAYELARYTAQELDPHWKPLILRLAADGFAIDELVAVFSELGEDSYTPAYMGTKITELYGATGIGVKRDQVNPVQPPPGYEQPLADFTIGSCVAFMKQHAEEFKDIQKRLGVPSHVIVGLLLIETALGTDLGKDSALRALASMAATTAPQQLGSKGNSGQVAKIVARSLATTLRQRSDWAYRETVALLRYSEDTGFAAAQIPGSIFGAIGICQFMPSNIEPYGVDGDGDGVINLFSPVDAMYSVARYLEAHGWRSAGNTTVRQHAVIRSYNHDDYYASSVLATAQRMKQALSGKLSAKSSAVAGGGGGVRASRLDPSLRRLRRPPASARVKPLGSYGDLLK